jgi:hypothetical protein
MADKIIDRLVSSLAAGLMGTDEFIDAVESQVLTIRPAAKDAREQPERCVNTAVRR